MLKLYKCYGPNSFRRPDSSHRRRNLVPGKFYLICSNDPDRKRCWKSFEPLEMPPDCRDVSTEEGIRDKCDGLLTWWRDVGHEMVWVGGGGVLLDQYDEAPPRQATAWELMVPQVRKLPAALALTVAVKSDDRFLKAADAIRALNDLAKQVATESAGTPDAESEGLKQKRKRRPRKGETDSDSVTLAALVAHHQYESGSVGSYEPATNRGLKDTYGLSSAALSRFLKTKGITGKQYKAACVSQRIGQLLMDWSDEKPTRTAGLFNEEGDSRYGEDEFE